MDNRTRQEKNDEIFINYPDVNLIAVTSDEKAFIDIDKALAHAGTLKDKSVERFKRGKSNAVKELEAIAAEKKAQEEAEALEKAEEDKKAQEEAEKAKFPEGEPSREWTKEELIAYGKEFYPSIKLTMRMLEDTILDNLAKAKSDAATASAE